MKRSLPDRSETGYRSSRWTALAGTAVLAATLLTGVSTTPAVAQEPAAPLAVDAAVFQWAINDESGGGAFFGGCNFLSAGTAGDTGSSRVWKEADGFYQTQAGNTRIEKPTAAGTFEAPTWSTKCKDQRGDTVTSANVDKTTGNRVVISAGTGTVDPAANTATIAWDGDFTVAYYGGLTYWSISDPTVVVAANGTGTVTATASGFGADMADPEKWVPLAPRPITLATLTGVQVTATGFTVRPDYLGVAVNTGTSAAQPAKNSGNAAYWGAFPQDFVDFQLVTGQAAYWYTSGGLRDPAKPAKPLTISIPSGPAPSITGQPTAQSVAVGSTYVFTVAAGAGVTYQWQQAAVGSTAWTPIAGATAATLSQRATTTGISGTRFRVVVGNGGGSVLSSAATLSVRKAAPTVTLALAAKVVHGQRTAATVTVGGPAGVAVAGAVAIKNGTTVIARGTLVAGKATIALPSTLTAGKKTITASYIGSVQLLAGSTAKSLTVTKAASTVKATLAKKSVAAGTRAKLTVKVTVAGATPTGKIVIKAGASGRTTVATVTLAAKNKGAVTVTLPVLAAGTHRVTAAYAGTTSIGAKTSAVQVLKVVKR